MGARSSSCARMNGTCWTAGVLISAGRPVLALTWRPAASIQRSTRSADVKSGTYASTWISRTEMLSIVNDESSPKRSATKARIALSLVAVNVAVKLRNCSGA